MESLFLAAGRARKGPGESLGMGRIPEGNCRFGLLVCTGGVVLV